MPSFRNAAKQAQHAITKVAAHGTARHGTVDSEKVHSIGSERNYVTALTGLTKYLQESKLGDLQGLTKDLAINYLQFRSETVGQKTLDLDRQAMRKLLGMQLPTIKSDLNQVLSSRAYTSDQARLVTVGQTPRNALSTQIAQAAGLRAHELLTLRPSSEGPADSHRPWSTQRFQGLNDVVIYCVQGKGGLVREVAIPRDLSHRLEALRLSEPRTVFDRGVRYLQHYNIAGGLAWSSSFSKASTRILGWSEGRMAYATPTPKQGWVPCSPAAIPTMPRSPLSVRNLGTGGPTSPKFI